MFKRPQDHKIKVDHKLNKAYSYTKGSANLSFTLNTGDKAGMQDFIDIMQAAIDEVKTDITGKTETGK